MEKEIFPSTPEEALALGLPLPPKSAPSEGLLGKDLLGNIGESMNNALNRRIIGETKGVWRSGVEGI